MASVFLSYSRDDLDKAGAVAAALERLGHSVWWDRRLQGGSRFSQEIDQALRSADAVVVLWSRSSIESAWVQDEAAEGRDSGRLVPVVIDDSKPPLGFRQYQSVDLSGWKGRGKSAAIELVHQALVTRAEAAGATESPATPPAAIPVRRRARTAAAIGLGVLAVIVAGLIGWLAWPVGQGNENALRLQLAEFKALSPDVPKQYPDTLREEILAALATDAVIVASTEQAEAGAASGYALGASVRVADDLLRFTLRLVDERSGGSVWTATFDRPLEPVGVAPRQVAVSASQVLRCGLGGAARHGKPLPAETLSIYFGYCEEYWAETAGKQMNATRALDLTRRLVAKAPDFSNGWAALALMATWAVRSNRMVDEDALRREATKAANRALELDPDNSEAYQALAGLQPPFAYAEREKLHLKSISVRPSDCGCEFVGYGSFLARVGRSLEAADAFKRAQDMIPLGADVNAHYAQSLMTIGRVDQARKVAATALETWPDYNFILRGVIRSAFWTGSNDEAMKLLASPATGLSEAERRALGNALRSLRGGAAPPKAAIVAALRQLAADEKADGALLVTALAALGATDDALGVAARQIERNGPRALPVLFDPALADARRSPQFARIVERFGLADYWRSSRKLPDFCKEASAPPLCASLS